jgi:Tfp pilus assembly protein PilF
VEAVKLDFWRAETAFTLADRLDAADAELIAAQRGEGKGAARVDYYWAQSLARRKDSAAAASAYRRSVSEDPDFGPSSFQLAAISYAAGDVAATAAAVRVFLAAKDKPIAMEGWAYLMVGNLESAESRLRSAVDAAPSNRWAWEGLAEVYSQRGDKHQEAAVWRAVLKNDPNHTRAAARLRALE